VTRRDLLTTSVHGYREDDPRQYPVELSFVLYEMTLFGGGAAGVVNRVLSDTTPTGR
jgi:hypothetical protein